MAEMLYARDVYGKALIELGKKDASVVVCDADLSGSTRTALFAKEFPKRFFVKNNVVKIFRVNPCLFKTKLYCIFRK